MAARKVAQMEVLRVDRMAVRKEVPRADRSVVLTEVLRVDRMAGHSEDRTEVLRVDRSVGPMVVQKEVPMEGRSVVQKEAPMAVQKEVPRVDRTGERLEGLGRMAEPAEVLLPLQVGVVGARQRFPLRLRMEPRVELRVVLPEVRARTVRA